MAINHKMVFVFGSNEGGYHGAGAALFAAKHHGAIRGGSYGHYNNSFAIPTMDASIRKALDVERIAMYVAGFLAYAAGRGELEFQVTCIGCGLAGLRHEDIAPLFNGAPSNCLFDNAWKPWLGTSKRYWGSFP